MPSIIKTKPLRPSWLRAHFARWALLAYKLGLGRLLKNQVLVLTTVGRVTGRPRNTPLWHVREGETVFCIAGWGSSSDWVKNLERNPKVTIQIGHRRWDTAGQVVSIPQERERVLSILVRKYGRRMVGMIYHLDRLVLVSFSLPSPTETLE